MRRTQLVAMAIAALTKNKTAWLSGCCYCADRSQPESVMPAPYNVVRVMQIAPKSVTVGGVISERVNTTRARCKLDALFG